MTETAPVSPPPQTALSATQVAAPTFGSLVGSALGAFITAKVAPHDPLLGSTIVTLVTGAVTALFHLTATKLGLPAI